MALLDEVSESKGVLVGISGSEPLVCHIEEREVPASLDGSADLLPLLRCRVDTSRVVGTGVQKEDASLGGTLDIREHALEVKTNCVLVVISVLLNLEPRVLEDSAVVCP